MSHELETIIVEGDTVASFSFAGVRKNIWHRLGQQFANEGLMSAEQAMQQAHMDRKLRIEPIPAPDGAQWAVDEKGASTAPSYVILEGKMFMTPDGGFGNIPEKVVGLAGNQAAQGHADLAVEDRFLLAEEAIHASHGAAVWSTAGYLRDGRQGFACMEAPPIIIDPNGIADVTQSYLTVTWSYDAVVPPSWARPTSVSSAPTRKRCTTSPSAPSSR